MSMDGQALAYRGVLGRLALLAVGALPLAVGAAPAGAGDGERVVVVCNADSPVSLAVGEDYARRRGVPNLLRVQCPDAAVSAVHETIPYATYQAAVETPLRAFLATRAGIDFIVLTKGIPIRIADAPGRGAGDCRPALDSTLAALGYESLPGATTVRLRDGEFTGLAWSNRYWNAAEPFSHARFGGYLVTRLDGYTEADAKALTTRSLAAESEAAAAVAGAVVLLDTCPAFGYASQGNQPRPLLATPPGPGELPVVAGELSFNEFNADMQCAAALLGQQRVPAELEQADLFVGERANLLGYVSWGSNDRHYREDAYRSLRFAPGALCETAVSTSARTFLPTQGGQSLIADLVAQGATGVKGYTDEPLLQAVASPSILFERYTRGWTLAESFYAASRLVGWEDIVIGDPLCRPYGR